MCRSIHQLHNFEPPAGEDEIREAALQYVRKVSGMRSPSSANKAAFDEAVDAVTAATTQLVGELVAVSPPRDRDVERARARIRWEKRQARMETAGTAASQTAG